jgi:hypothetical protein
MNTTASKLINMMLVIGFGILATSVVRAEISDDFRKKNAVVLYEFNDDVASTTIADTACQDPLSVCYNSGTPPAAVNLSILAGSSSVGRAAGSLSLSAATQIRSTSPATKIKDLCGPQNELSVEIWYSLKASAKIRTEGLEDKNKQLQPLRLLSYSSGLYDRNFLVGVEYDMGDHLVATVGNSSNRSGSPLVDNSLRTPLMSDKAAIFVPGQTTVNETEQHMIMTYRQGLASLYLTDVNNHIFKHKTASTDFKGTLGNNWNAGSYLVLGNEFMANDANLVGNLGIAKTAANCPIAGSACRDFPNKYIMASYSKIAIYCKALTEEDILPGSTLAVRAAGRFNITNLNMDTTSLRRASELYTRITGAKSSIVNPVVGSMATLIDNQAIGDAVDLATRESNFYNITVRDFAAKMSNRDETITVPLNDFTATIIGAVRDNVDARKLLTDNIVYIGDSSKGMIPSNTIADMIRSNNHYQALSDSRYDLSQILVQSKQKVLNDKGVAVDNTEAAGLLTTRAFMSSHAIAGTNRRPVEYTLREFLCSPLETVADPNGPDNVIGRDIDRLPAGSATKFTTTCRACHTVMDGFRGAFAHYTFSNDIIKNTNIMYSNQVLLTSGADPKAVDEAKTDQVNVMPELVVKKLNHNETVFPKGRVIIDDSWVNNANLGANNVKFAWTANQGSGISEFGSLISKSKQFPICMAQRVFKQVCKREVEASDQVMIQEAAKKFTDGGFVIRDLFKTIAIRAECMGGGQ